MNPALNSDEWRRLEWSRHDGTNPSVWDDGGMQLDGCLVNDPDELRAIIALAMESLRRLGEPLFTHQDMHDLRNMSGDALYDVVSDTADILEALLPPDAEDG